MKKASILFIAFIIFSCDSKKETINTYWVNSSKVDCVGVAPTTCLQIQKGETIIQENWELFYSAIEGFEYQSGFIYKLNIKEENIDNVPADASSIKYILLEILEKKKDKRFDVHDIWILENLVSNNSLDLNKIKTIPQIKINVTKMTVFGTNGCNNISGSIKMLNDSIIEFNVLMETRMACPNMEITRQFSFALTETKSYKKKENQLIFLNGEGKEVLVFMKGD